MCSKLKINKKLFQGEINEISLKRKQRFKILCESCDKEYSTYLAIESTKKNPWMCKKCGLRKSFSTRQNAVVKEGILFNFEFPMQSTDINGNLLGNYQKFKLQCLSCKKEYETTISNENSKKNRLKCASCAIKLEWKEKKYRSKHCEAFKEAANRPEVKKRQSELSIARWNNDEIRDRMLNGQRKTRSTDEWKKAASERSIKWHLENPGKCSFKSRRQGYYISKLGIKYWFRSSYEFRFAKILDEIEGLLWEYESKSYKVNIDNRITVYLPDFIIPSRNLIIEVKGYFYPDARKKWDAFCVQYPQIKKLLIRKRELEVLESGESFEDQIKKQCG